MAVATGKYVEEMHLHLYLQLCSPPWNKLTGGCRALLFARFLGQSAPEPALVSLTLKSATRPHPAKSPIAYDRPTLHSFLRPLGLRAALLPLPRWSRKSAYP